MSTQFLNGPAGTKVLMLRRSPRFLRVTRDADGEIDGLDQLADEPTAAEDVFAYRRIGFATTGMIDVRGRGGRRTGGRFSFARYALVEPQPDGHVLRDRPAWQAWCRAAAAAIGPSAEEPGHVVAAAARAFGLSDVGGPSRRPATRPVDRNQGLLFGGRP